MIFFIFLYTVACAALTRVNVPLESGETLSISLPIHKLVEDDYINFIIYFKPNGSKYREELFKARYKSDNAMVRKSQVDPVSRYNYQVKNNETHLTLDISNLDLYKSEIKFFIKESINGSHIVSESIYKVVSPFIDFNLSIAICNPVWAKFNLGGLYKFRDAVEGYPIFEKDDLIFWFNKESSQWIISIKEKENNSPTETSDPVGLVMSSKLETPFNFTEADWFVADNGTWTFFELNAQLDKTVDVQVDFDQVNYPKEYPTKTTTTSTTTTTTTTTTPEPSMTFTQIGVNGINCTIEDQSLNQTGEVIFRSDNPYRSNQYCNATFKCPVGQTISYKFNRFNLESDSDCDYDHLSLEGEYLLYLKGKYCTGEPWDIGKIYQSGNNEFGIEFKSDGSQNFSGFEVVLTCAEW